MRRKRAARAGPAAIHPAGGDSSHELTGKPELAGNPITGAAAAAPPPSPSPSVMKPGHSPIVNSVSPVSQHSSMYPPPGTPELQGNSHPPMPQWNNAFPPPPNRPELQGQMYNPNGNMPPKHAELQGQMYGNAPPPNRPELYGQSYSAPPPPQPPPPQGYYGQAVHEFPGQSAVHQADSRPVPPRAELQGGMSWQSGPVSSYAELDGGYGGGIGHAR
jgi:hypothetical protein